MERGSRIHDPVVLSSGAVVTGATRGIAIAVVGIALAAGGWLAYQQWKKDRPQ